MRLLLLLIALQGLSLTVYCEDVDDITAKWLLCNGPDRHGNSNCPNSHVEGKRNKRSESTDLNPGPIEETLPCATSDGESGVCVQYYECVTVIAEDEEMTTNTCTSFLQVCCKRSDVNITQPTSTTEVAVTLGPRSNIDDTEVKPDTKIISNKECGWSNPDITYEPPQTPEEKSTMATYGEFPWIVAVMKKTDDSDVWSQADYLGSGTLIHPSVVLAVAHLLAIRKKILKPDQLKCRAGEYDTQSTLEPYSAQERNVAKYYSHEKYYRMSLYNDIALLVLKAPFELGSAPHIGTACLAKELPLDRADCFVTGWGKVHIKEYATVLRKLKFKFVAHDRCETMLKTSRLGQGPYELHESLTCASGMTGMNCAGGSGSPLVCPVTNRDGKVRYAVYGIMAYGIICTSSFTPLVYANVPHLRSWVNEKMQLEGINDQSYTF